MTSEGGKLVILLSGERGSGKDTIGAHLTLSHGFRRVAFADELRSDVLQAYSGRLHMKDLTARWRKESPLLYLPVTYADETSRKLQEIFSHELASGFWTPRALMILEGALRRCVDPHYWVRCVADEIADSTAFSKFVITDWRFRSERDALQRILSVSKCDIQFQSWRVIRPDIPTSPDTSERDLDEVEMDVTIWNDRSISDLERTIDLQLQVDGGE